MRLDKYLASQINNTTRSKIQQLIKKKAVFVNNRLTEDAAYKIRSEDIITLLAISVEKHNILPRQMNLNIIYEDEHLAIINKSAGVTTHPGAGNHNDTLVNGLIEHFQSNLSTLGGCTRPGIVHRLDKNTSGVIVIAKNDHAHVKLSEQLQRREIKRTYNAVVWGVPAQVNGTIVKNIGRSRQNRKKMQILEFGGKTAITHYKVLKVFLNNTFSLIQCDLETGRTHQIRVHLKYLGCPIVGDPEYGHIKKKRKEPLSDTLNEYLAFLSRQMLHAKRIKFAHPINEKLIDYEIGLPYDMAHLIQILEQ